MLGLMSPLIRKNRLPARIRGWAGTATGRHIHVVHISHTHPPKELIQTQRIYLLGKKCYAVLHRRGYKPSQRQEVSCTKADDNDTVAEQTLVPGMSLYEFSQVSDAESQAVGDEEPMIFDS